MRLKLIVTHLGRPGRPSCPLRRIGKMTPKRAQQGSLRVPQSVWPSILWSFKKYQLAHLQTHDTLETLHWCPMALWRIVEQCIIHEMEPFRVDLVIGESIMQLFVSRILQCLYRRKRQFHAPHITPIIFFGAEMARPATFAVQFSRIRVERTIRVNVQGSLDFRKFGSIS